MFAIITIAIGQFQKLSIKKVFITKTGASKYDYEVI